MNSVSTWRLHRACWASAGALGPATGTKTPYRRHFTLATPKKSIKQAPICLPPGSTAAAQETTTVSRWETFAESVSGEWDGVTATFDDEGKPQPLPEYYVPQAYRDWGVELFDWQSQCSMLGSAEGLSYTHRRMMPTVGCEADAIAFTSQQQQVFPSAGEAATVNPLGCYSNGDVDLLGEDKSTAAIEHCLVLQPAERVRVVHNLRRSRLTGKWQVAGIDVHRERREAPYNGRVELTGCGGGMEAFAEKPALDGSRLEGAWTVSEGAEFTFGAGGTCSERSTAGSQWSRGSGDDTILLPLGMWTAVALAADDVRVEVGVLDGQGVMHMGIREYEGGRLSRVCLQTLEKK